MCIASCSARRIDILDNPRRNADCGVRLGEGKVPSPRALSTLSTRSIPRQSRGIIMPLLICLYNIARISSLLLTPTEILSTFPSFMTTKVGMLLT